MLKKIILHIFLALQLSYNLILLNNEHFEDRTHNVDPDQIDDFLASRYDFRERFNLRRSSPNKDDDFSKNPQVALSNKARIHLIFTAKATTITVYQCSLSCKKLIQLFGYNTNTNHYHG